MKKRIKTISNWLFTRIQENKLLECCRIWPPSLQCSEERSKNYKKLAVYLFKIHSSWYKKASRFIWQQRPDRPGPAWAGQSRFPQSQSKRGLLDTPSSSFRHRTVALSRKNNYGNKNTARESEDAESIPGQKTKTAETQNRENTVLAVSRTGARSHREKLIRVKFASKEIFFWAGADFTKTIRRWSVNLLHLQALTL